MYWPKVEVIKDGRVVVCDGFVVVFFLRESNTLIVERIEKALLKYVSFVGVESLPFYIDENGYTAPLTQDSLEHLVTKWFRGSKVDSELSITLLGDETNVSGYEFHYYGSQLPVEGWPDYRNYLYCWFPSKFTLNAGFISMRNFATDLASILPLSFGYASPALLYHHEIGEATTRTRRYLGFDVLLARSIGMELDDRAAGVYWLSFLGTELTRICGGIESIRSSLPLPVTVESLDLTRTMITLGSEPEIGDQNRKGNMFLYRELAKVMRPVLHMPIRNYFADKNNEPDREAMETWHRRFLD